MKHVSHHGRIPEHICLKDLGCNSKNLKVITFLIMQMLQLSPQSFYILWNLRIALENCKIDQYFKFMEKAENTAL